MSLNEGAPAYQPLPADRLGAAVGACILSREQADRLAEFWIQPLAADDPESLNRVDAEEVRFVRGFHDVFIAIGIVILLFGLTYGLRGVAPASVIGMIAAIAVWAMSEVFAKRMRLALPSFLLTLFFTPLFFISCLGFLAGYDGNGMPGSRQIASNNASALILPTVIALAGAALHYLRFKVPAGLAAITAAGLVLLAVLLEAAIPGVLDQHFVWFTLFAGIASFAVAMVFDCRDLKRVTINSDNAFWLHLLAAPLVVHSVLQLVAGDVISDGTAHAVLVIATFLVLAFVAIIVDRRALLVSGLGYFGFAIASLMSGANVSGDARFAVTLVLLGCFILLLGSAWRFVRRLLVSPLSSTPIMRFVPAAG